MRMVHLCHLRMGWHGAPAPVLASSAGDLLLSLQLQYGFHQVQQHLHGDDWEMRMWFSGLLCMTRVSTEEKTLEMGWMAFARHAFCDDSPLCVHIVVAVVVVE